MSIGNWIKCPECRCISHEDDFEVVKDYGKPVPLVTYEPDSKLARIKQIRDEQGLSLKEAVEKFREEQNGQ